MRFPRSSFNRCVVTLLDPVLTISLELHVLTFPCFKTNAILTLLLFFLFL